MKNKSKIKYLYEWYCNWTNGKGCYNPDYEGCSQSRKGYKSEIAAAVAGREHAQCHGWDRWGSPPENNWRDSLIYVSKYSGKKFVSSRSAADIFEDIKKWEET